MVRRGDAPARSSRDLAIMAVVAGLVLLTRLPFLSAGYGADPDAWRLAGAARAIAESGQYVYSRAPGYPVPEIVGALLWRLGLGQVGYWPLNLATALAGALAVGYFALTVRRVAPHAWILASIALAFTPVVYVNSTNAMDYVWALAPMLAASYYAISGRPIVAGACLGLAVGCRITSGAMLLPLGLVLWGQEMPAKAWPRILRMSAVALMLSALLYAPVVIAYGTGFFYFYENGYPSLDTVAARATVGVWGWLGCVGIAGAALSLLMTCETRAEGREAGSALANTSNRAFVWQQAAWLTAVLLFVVAYLRLPHEAGYLVPAVPFALLLLVPRLHRWVAVGLAGALVASSFVSPRITCGGMRDVTILACHDARVIGLAFTDGVVMAGAVLEDGAVVVAGPELPRILAHPDVQDQADVSYIYLVDEEQWVALEDAQRPVYYLPCVSQYNAHHFGVDLAGEGACLLALP